MEKELNIASEQLDDVQLGRFRLRSFVAAATKRRSPADVSAKSELGL